MKRLGLLVLLVAGCGGGGNDRQESSSSGGGGKAKTERYEHARSDFTIEAPAGYKLRVRKGVYVLRKGDRSISYSRAVTDTSPEDYGNALVAQLGGDIEMQRSDAGEFNAELNRGGVRDTIVVVRGEDGLTTITARSPAKKPLDIETVQVAGASAKGGYTLKPPPAQAETIELEQYRTADGGATALVPAGWNISGSQGVIEGSSDQGRLLFGFSYDVILPENAPPGAEQYNVIALPYLDSTQAAQEVLQRLDTNLTDMTITRTLAEGVLPGFTSSGMYEFTYKVAGNDWIGVATVASDSPEKYSNYQWKLYYSGIGVPQGSDPSVGAGLLQSWKSWDPSGAIAQRSEKARELLDATNDVWKETSEFRSRQADRQSRDVGCLLQGYYEFEDNSRKYDLPPLPCDQQYVP